MKKNQIKRSPKRAIYQKEEIYQILDKEYLCHVGFIHENYPVVIPTMYGREADFLYIHGSSVSRLIKQISTGIDVCLSIANVTGWVLARSAYHHSLNYESVVVFGKAKLVSDEEKPQALKIISDHLIKGRWEEVRPPSEKELKATQVLKIEIEQISAKKRTGDPLDEKEDYQLPIWAGVLPVDKKIGTPLADEKLNPEIALPNSLLNFIKKAHE